MSQLYPSSDDSEATNSQQSYEINAENNYSENEDVHVESDTKSATSQNDYYFTNSSNGDDDDDVIKKISNQIISNEKNYIDYGNDDVDDAHHRRMDDSDIQNSTPLRTTFCTITLLLIGVLLFAAGLFTIVVPVHEILLRERLKMQPYLPPYKEWVIPSPEVRLNVYIFAVANSEAFLNGTDDKLRLTEIGPIVYREHLHHQNVVFHDNSTLSYTANRRLEFLDDQNEPGIMDRVILVPNFVLLATAAKLNDEYAFTKAGFVNFVLGPGDTVFLNMTIHNYLWNYKNDFLEGLKSLPLGSLLVPTDNAGCLHQIYADFNDRYNVRIGPGYDENNFFTITSVNGGSSVPGFDVAHGECNASIVGSTEGALYKTNLNEESVLWYWRKPLCRQVPLYYEGKIQKQPFDAYKYVLLDNAYDRTNNLTQDCFKGFKQVLPNGLSDVSKCFFGMPFAASNPHFYGRYPNELTKKLDGFKPDRERHQSFIIIEPIMGVPIDQSARSQSNVIIPDLYGFTDEIQRFSNMALPTFWVEYHQKQLTENIENMMYFSLYILPVVLHILKALILLAGITCLIKGVLRCMAANSDDYQPEKRNTASPKFNTDCKAHDADIPWNFKCSFNN